MSSGPLLYAYTDVPGHSCQLLIVDIKEFFNDDDSAQDPSSIHLYHSRGWLYTCSLGSILANCSHPTVIQSSIRIVWLYLWLSNYMFRGRHLLVLKYFVPTAPTSGSLSQGYTTQPGTSRQ